MKKTYTKPEIVFEDFSLSISIAVGCDLKTSLPSYEESCGYQESPRDHVIFVDSIKACEYKPQGGDYNGFCYHNPSDENNLFNS